MTILSNQEFQIFRWLCNGYTEKQIAAEMNCSRQTIHYHITKVKRRIGAVSLYHLIALLFTYSQLQPEYSSDKLRQFLKRQ